MARRITLSSVPLLAMLVLALTALPRPAWSAEAKDYAYLFVQGRITDKKGQRPMARATVRLTAGGQAHETLTDDRGAFSFDHLPVDDYRMEVRDTEGKVIRGVYKVEKYDPDRTRLRVQFGYGAPSTPVLKPGAEGLDVIAPKPPVRWRLFWTELAIFVGTAAVLAL